MEPTSAQNLPRIKTNKRPDSLKVELLTISERGTSNTFPNSAVNVGFKDISYSVKEGLFRKKPRKLLDKINGEFLGGELSAIMGPSGSGKTSLMNILAGFTNNGVTGQKFMNDEVRNEDIYRSKSCYIMQDDHLQPLLTIQEAMHIAANLKLNSTYSTKDKHARVKEILESVNLWVHRKTRTDALSGGEKKRLSISLELLTNPQVMFFDEPTSGLDSLSSKQCIFLLKELAMTGRTVICTIHQPSALILEMFDHLYVLAGGKCMYQGSVKGLLPYLDDSGLRCPTYHNPADYLLEVVSGEYGDYRDVLSDKSENGVNQEWRKTQKNSSLNSEYRVQSEKLMLPTTPATLSDESNCDNNDSCKHACCDTYPTSFFNQLSVLLKRTFLVVSRDKSLTYSRLITHSSIALFIGTLYRGIGIDASNMQNNSNHIFFTVMFLMLTAFNCVATTFPYELPILTREHFNKWYSLKSYFLAISLADIPVQMTATLIYALVTYFLTMQPAETYRVCLFIIMCILISMVSQSFGLFIGACLDIKNGVIFGPFCLLPFIIFSGFFVQLNDAHPYLRWIFHVSFLKYGFEGLILSVLGYNRGKLPCNAEYCHYVYPEKFLSQMDMEYAKYWIGVIFLVSVTIVIRTAAYLALSLRVGTK